MVKTNKGYRGQDGRSPTAVELFSLGRKVDDALLEQTIRLFEARTGRSLSKEDARQIVENVTGFFRILSEWDRAEQTKKPAPPKSPAA